MKTKEILITMNRLITILFAFIFFSCSSDDCITPNGVKNCECLNESSGIWLDNGSAYTGACEQYNGDTLYSKAEFVKGRMHGTFSEYYPNGNKSFEATYEDGGLNGWVIYYRENGEKDQEGNVGPLGKNGDWKMYYPSGQLKAHDQYENNVLSGACSLFYENGQLQSVGTYDMGVERGAIQFFDSITGEFDGFGMFEDGNLAGIAPVFDGSWPMFKGKGGGELALHSDTSGIFKGFTTQIQLMGFKPPITVQAEGGQLDLISKGHDLYNLTANSSTAAQLRILVYIDDEIGIQGKPISEFSIPVYEMDMEF